MESQDKKCIESQNRQWFAARVRKGQEFATGRALERLGIEYYLATRVETRQLKYRKKRVEVPLINNLIFVRATKQQACDVSNIPGVKLFYLHIHYRVLTQDRKVERRKLKPCNPTIQR